MLLIFPVTYETQTTLTPKRLARKLDGELTEFKPTLNIMATGKFMKKHKTESLYYGRREGEEFSLFYHQAKKRDGGETGFFGKFEKSENGSRIYGKFRKPVYTYVFGILWTLAALFLALMSLAVGEKTGALVFAAVWLAGIFFLFWDNKKRLLRAFLENLPRTEDSK